MASATALVPTGREAYVGCFLLTHGADVPIERDPPMYSAAECLLLVGIGAEREEGKPIADRRFCPPNTHLPGTLSALAASYVDFYERTGGRLAGASGIDVATAAFSDKWPCR